MTINVKTKPYEAPATETPYPEVGDPPNLEPGEPGAINWKLRGAGYKYDGKDGTANADDADLILRSVASDTPDPVTTEQLVEDGVLVLDEATKTWSIDKSKLKGRDMFDAVGATLAATDKTYAEKMEMLERIGISKGQQQLLILATGDLEKGLDQELTSEGLNGYFKPENLFVANENDGKIIGINGEAAVGPVNEGREGMELDNQPPVLQLGVDEKGNVTPNGAIPATQLPAGVAIPGNGVPGLPPAGAPGARTLAAAADVPAQAGLGETPLSPGALARFKADPIGFMAKSGREAAHRVQALVSGNLSGLDRKIFENALTSNKATMAGQMKKVEAAAVAAGYDAAKDGDLGTWINQVNEGKVITDAEALKNLNFVYTLANRMQAQGFGLDAQVGHQDFGQLPADLSTDQHGNPVPSIWASHAGSIPRLHMSATKRLANGNQEVTFSGNLLNHVGMRMQLRQGAADNTFTGGLRALLPGGESGMVNTQQISFKVTFDQNGNYIQTGQVKLAQEYGIMHRHTFDGLATLSRFAHATENAPGQALTGMLANLRNGVPREPDLEMGEGEGLHALAGIPQLPNVQNALTNAMAVGRQERNAPLAAFDAMRPWVGNGELIGKATVKTELDLSALFADAKGFAPKSQAFLMVLGGVVIAGAGAGLGFTAAQEYTRHKLTERFGDRAVTELMERAVGDSGFLLASVDSLADIAGLGGAQLGGFLAGNAWSAATMRDYLQVSVGAGVIGNPLTPALGTMITTAVMPNGAPRVADFYVNPDGSLSEILGTGPQRRPSQNGNWYFPYPRGGKGRLVLNYARTAFIPFFEGGRFGSTAPDSPTKQLPTPPPETEPEPAPTVPPTPPEEEPEPEPGPEPSA